MKKNNIQIQSCTECSNDNKIFCCLSHEEKLELSNNKGSSFFKKGQVIFYEGNHSNGLFCVHKGKIKLTKRGQNGKEQVVRFAKTGDILGYRALLSNEPYHATATAIEDCHICSLSKDNFISLLRSNSKLSWNTMRLLSTNLKNAEKHLININQKTVKERIAEALVLLYQKFGLSQDGVTLNILLSRTEIADFAGTTTATTIRTLATLNKESIIELKGKEIKIPNIKKLIAAASIHD